METYIRESLAGGLIHPLSSPVDASFFSVVKKHKTLQPCIHFRGLNDITVKNNYPLPLCLPSVPSTTQEFSLSSAHLLVHPDPQLQFVVGIDTLDFGVGYPKCSKPCTCSGGVTGGRRWLLTPESLSPPVLSVPAVNHLIKLQPASSILCPYLYLSMPLVYHHMMVRL